MLFIDQICSEGGKTQICWLLMALPEPNFSVLVKRASGIRPFSRLWPSLWMSANIAFLREVDWLGSRVGAAPPSSQPSNSAKKEEQTELDDSSFEGASAKAQASRAEGLHPGSASDMFPTHSPPKQLPLKPACFLRWVLSFLGFTRSARNSLGSVLRSSLQPSACAALPEPTSGEIWTVPLPYWRRRTAKLSSCSPNPR